MSLTQLKPWIRRSLFGAAAIVVGPLSLGAGSAPAQAQYYPDYAYPYPYGYPPYYYQAYYDPYAYGYPYWGPGISVGFAFGGHRHG